MYKVPLFKLNYNHKEEKAIKRVIKTQWLTMGQETIDLENYFSKQLTNNYHTIAVSSCTSHTFKFIILKFKKK